MMQMPLGENKQRGWIRLDNGSCTSPLLLHLIDHACSLEAHPDLL